MTDAVLSGVLAGNANAVSMLFTNPLDVAKIRFQTTAQGRGLTQTDKVSTVGNVIRIFRQEGVRGIYKGICISMIREQTYSAARFGLYEVRTSLLPISGFNATALMSPSFRVAF